MSFDAGEHLLATASDIPVKHDRTNIEASLETATDFAHVQTRKAREHSAVGDDLEEVAAEGAKSQEIFTIENVPDKIANRIQTIQSLAESIQLNLTTKKSSISPELSTLLSAIRTCTSGIQTLATTTISAGLVGEFAYFPKLPIELRLKIWKEALPGPRILEVFHDAVFDEPCDSDDGIDAIIRSNLAPPTLLHVCRESRQVALEKYTELGFSGIPCFTWIDPTQDTVYLPYSEDGWKQKQVFYAKAFSGKVGESLKSLAMDSRMWDVVAGNDFGEGYPALEVFTLIMHEDKLVEEEHEAWRRQTTGIEFLDVQVPSRRKASAWLIEVGDYLIWWKKSHDNQNFALKIKTLARGGKKCCSL